VSAEGATASVLPESAPAAAQTRKLPPGTGWLLAVCCVAQFMVILDLSIINVALPSIQIALNFSSPDLQWVVDAYAIAFAGFLMLGGRAADHFGQRRTFVAAMLLFGIASLLGGLAQDRIMLISARGLQGFAGALMAASSLAIITANFKPGPQLHRAIGTWASMNGAGGAAGVLFGGVITQELSWRWVLLINPPIAIAAAVIAHKVVRERRRAPDARFDLAGALTLTIGQVVLVYGVVEAGLAGWSSANALVPIIVGIALLALFGQIENHFAKAPLIPFKELTPALRIANTIVLLFSASIFPMWIVSSLYLQQVLGLSPLDTGLIFLPMTLAIMAVASRAGRLVSQFGVRIVLGSGLVMMTAGFLLLSKIASSGSGVVYVMIPGLLVAAGIAMSIVPSTIAATQGAKERQAGLASGLVNTSRQVGGGLGLAVLLILATQHSTGQIGHGIHVPQALTDGFRLAFLIGAGLTAVSGLMTLLLLPRAAPARRRAALGLVGVVALAIAAFVGVVEAFEGNHGAPIGKYSLQNTLSFVSAPSLHPPKIRLSKNSPGRPAGYVFMTNFLNVNEPPIQGQSGPLILERDLQPVWFQPVPEKYVAGDLTLASWEGKPALAYWQGVITKTGEIESGEDIVVNQHYQVVARLKAKGGWVVTIHAVQVVGEDAWVSVNENIPKDLSAYGGAYNGALVDSAVQEYDLRTGKLLYSWDALEHIPLSQSHATIPTNGFPWDAYHVNAVQVLGNGTFLVSMRDTWAAYLVNIASGRIEWTLGGRDSDFKFAKDAEFRWQHDVEMQPNGEISMFDDHCCQLTGGGTYVHAGADSRGIVLKLNQTTHTARLVGQYGQDEGLESDYMGSTEPLADGNVFLGWGSEPYFSEYTSSGRVLYEAELPGPDLSYRAELRPWVGLPLTKPAAAARTTAGNTTVYASWNGATRVVSWRVLAGPSATQLSAVASAARAGFETAIPLPQMSPASQSFEVQALGADGRVIGASRPFASGA
jgi:EmrB/QacA subfamily drug resistance transporter